MWKSIQSWFSMRKKEEELPTTLNLLKSLVNEKKAVANPINDAEFSGKIKDEIYFEHRNILFVDSIALKTIRYIKKDSYGYHHWRASLREYEQVYCRADLWGKFLEEEVKPMITYLDSKKEDSFYQFILEQQFPQVLLITESIQEMVELEGYVPDDVAEKCVTLLRHFFKGIKELNQDYKQNILNKLDQEIEYLQYTSLRNSQGERREIEKVVR